MGMKIEQRYTLLSLRVLGAAVIGLVATLFFHGCTSADRTGNQSPASPTVGSPSPGNVTPTAVQPLGQATPCPSDCQCSCPRDKDGTCPVGCGCQCPGGADQPIDVAGGSTGIEFDESFFKPGTPGVYTSTGWKVSSVEVQEKDPSGNLKGSPWTCAVPANGLCTITIHSRRPDTTDKPIMIKGSASPVTVGIQFEPGEYGSQGGKKHYNANNKIKEDVEVKNDNPGGSITKCRVPASTLMRVRVHVMP